MTPIARQRPTGGVVAVLITCGILASMMQTLVLPLLGELPYIFDTTPSDASWIVTSTLLAGAVSTPVLGRLADQYGKKRMLLIALLFLILGSVVCALATALIPMIVGRTLQGFATGIVVLGISLLHDVLPARKVAAGIALMSASLGVGGAIGLPIAAALAEYTDWRTLFWSVGVASVVVGALIVFLVDAPATRRAAVPFDYLGVLGLTIILLSVLLAISKGGEWGWTSVTTLGLVVLAIVVTPIWCWLELRTRSPLVNLRVAARGTVLLTNLASILVGFALYAQSLVIPQLMQLPVGTGYGHGQSMLQMALWVAPSGIVMMLAAPFAARLTATRGAKTTLVSGAVIIALGYAAATQVSGSLWGLTIAMWISSIGTGFAFGAMPTLILDAVPASEKAAANGLNALMRSLGMTASAAVIGAVLAHLTTEFGGRLIPTEAGFIAGLVIGSGAALFAALVAGAIQGPAEGVVAVDART
ncbi:MAG TPA: MFS transporter [Microbacterium sp.]|uniref:MFS transporter n=1 Tax=Microbacterium sp. TaxID=51671 RepID=UPI002CC10520|nr:MFS transporter [Microbacterium sp.]HWI30541.1 MFS transporter [Microbacterium sp.]